MRFATAPAEGTDSTQLLPGQFWKVRRGCAGGPIPPVRPRPLCEAVEGYLQWLDLDRHASQGTVSGYRDESWRFQTSISEWEAGV